MDNQKFEESAAILKGMVEDDYDRMEVTSGDEILSYMNRQMGSVSKKMDNSESQ